MDIEVKQEEVIEDVVSVLQEDGDVENERKTPGDEFRYVDEPKLQNTDEGGDVIQNIEPNDHLSVGFSSTGIGSEDFDQKAILEETGNKKGISLEDIQNIEGKDVARAGVVCGFCCYTNSKRIFFFILLLLATMCYKFTFESFTTGMAVIIIRRMPKEVAVTTYGILRIIYNLIQTLSSPLVVPLTRCCRASAVLSCVFLVFMLCVANLLVIETATEGSFWLPYNEQALLQDPRLQYLFEGNRTSVTALRGLAGNALIPGWKGMPWLCIIVMFVAGFCYGYIEVLRKLLVPLIAESVDTVCMSRLNSIVHISYEIAGTSGAFMGGLLVDLLGPAYCMIPFPICFFLASLCILCICHPHVCCVNIEQQNQAKRDEEDGETELEDLEKKVKSIEDDDPERKLKNKNRFTERLLSDDDDNDGIDVEVRKNLGDDVDEESQQTQVMDVQSKEEEEGVEGVGGDDEKYVQKKWYEFVLHNVLKVLGALCTNCLGFLNDFCKGFRILFCSKHHFWLLVVYSFPQMMHRTKENIISPVYATLVVEDAGYTGFLLGSSNGGELLGAILVLLVSFCLCCKCCKCVPLFFTMLGVILMNLLWVFPFVQWSGEEKDTPSDIRWKILLCFLMVIISIFYASGDISQLSYIGGTIKDKAAMASVMTIFYLIYVICMVILYPVIGQIIDQSENANEGLKGALVILTLASMIVLFFSFIGCFCLADPDELDDGDGEEEGMEVGEDGLKKKKRKDLDDSEDDDREIEYMKMEEVNRINDEMSEDSSSHQSLGTRVRVNQDNDSFGFDEIDEPKKTTLFKKEKTEFLNEREGFVLGSPEKFVDE